VKSLFVKVSGAVLLLAIAFAARPALAAANVLDFLVLGQGAVTNDCPVGPNIVDCDVILDGQADGTHIGHDDFDLHLHVGTLSARLNNGAGGGGGFCAVVTGFGTFTPPSQATAITFNLVGTVCEESNLGSPAHFNGTYRITGGSARFAGAVGGGNLSSTFTRNPGGVVFLHLHGVINF